MNAAKRPWWSGPLPALGWCVLSLLASAPASLLALTFGQSAWTGCWAGACDAAPSPAAALAWSVWLAVTVATPLLVLAAAWRAWAGWWLVGLGLSVAHLALWAGLMGYI